MVLGDQVWWNTLQHIHEITEDVVNLLRLVDGPLESSGKVYYYMARLAANIADVSHKFCRCLTEVPLARVTATS